MSSQRGGVCGEGEAGSEVNVMTHIAQYAI